MLHLASRLGNRQASLILLAARLLLHAPEVWPIALFMVVMLSLGIKRYRQTLD